MFHKKMSSYFHFGLFPWNLFTYTFFFLLFAFVTQEGP